MLASQIIRSLPESLDWMVLFDLSTLRQLVADEAVRGMFGLPESMDLDHHSHIILTSQGKLAAAREGSKLNDPIRETVFSVGEREACLYRRFSCRFDLFPIDEADCMAIGEMPPFPPVLLHLRSEAGYGDAKAVFTEEPSEQHYELLKAVGVEYLGGSREGPYYVAQFRNHLPTHIHSAELARFTRTSHCRLFFLRHGSIDRRLEHGLIKASAGRVAWVAQLAREALVRLAGEAGDDRDLALTCQPPPPAKPFASGDVVPLGFLLKVLDYHTSAASIFSNVEVRKRLLALLQHRRQELFWPHQVGGPVSSIASALVLQGFRDPQGVEALEAFADGRGGYYTRLRADKGEPGVVGGSKGYRSQPDVATTCLIRALRNDVELATKTSIECLTSRFESRSGLHFANPYLVDWALACALEKDESAQELRDLLAAEILASMNDDHSFGLFDVPTSSAFAILSMAALGRRGRTLRIAQLRLLDFVEPDGTFPPGTPFYSARAAKQEDGHAGIAARREQQRQVIEVDRGLYEVSYYLDGHKTISTAAATLALLAECSPADRDSDSIKEQRSEAHPRYRCRNHAEYVQWFALPPYTGESPWV